MKKIFTLLAGAAVSVAGFAAIPAAANLQPLEIKMSPEREAMLRAESIVALTDVNADRDAEYTRYWEGPDGSIWLLSLNLFDETLLEFTGMTDPDEGLTWENYPFYMGRYMLRQLSADQQSVNSGVIFYIEWPSEYMAKQIWEPYDGELVDGDIPYDERKYDPIKPSVLLNDSQLCRKFTESQYIGCHYDRDSETIDTWYMLPNSVLGVTGLYNGQEAETILDETTASNLDFSQYDVSDNSITVKNRIYLSTERIRRATIANTFSGIADVEGFEPRTVISPVGEIHVFNAGLMSSESLGDDNVFTEEFGDVTAFYVATANEKMVWIVEDEGVVPFDSTKIRLALADPTAGAPADEDYNLIAGYVFADKKYGEDLTLNPTEMSFQLDEGNSVLDPSTDKYYLSIYPRNNKFVKWGYTYAWSEEYGLGVDNLGSGQILSGSTNYVQWGTTEGFHGYFVTQFSRYITNDSKADIVYHYDPANMNLTRTFSSVGTMEPHVGINAVKADETMKAQIAVRNGQIVVNASEVAPVAIFTLDGKLVKSVKAANVAVEAPKGVYVVRVGNKAAKVIL